MPHELFVGGLKARGIYPELSKYFYKENSNVTWEEFQQQSLSYGMIHVRLLTTIFTPAADTPTVTSELQSTSEKLWNWFEKNYLKANLEKCNMLLSSKSSVETKIGGVSVKSTQMETLLGVSINSELYFGNRISNIWSKVSKKLNALGRIFGYITFEDIVEGIYWISV